MSKAWWIVALAGLLAGCETVEGARVNIVYEQIANFATYKLSEDSSSSSGPGSSNEGPGVFVLYRIEQISNEGELAEPFTFDPGRLLTITNGALINEDAGSQNILLGDQHLASLEVDAGETLTESDGLGCFIKVARSENLDDLNQFDSLVELMHEIQPEQPVTLKRASGDTDTALILGDALPFEPNVGLQQLCDSE